MRPNPVALSAPPLTPSASMNLGARGTAFGHRGVESIIKGPTEVTSTSSPFFHSPFSPIMSSEHCGNNAGDNIEDASASAPPPPPSPNPTEVPAPPPNPGARWYVVFAGRRPGIYTDWHTAAAHVIGVPNSVYKKYRDYESALAAFQASQEASRANDVGEPEDNATPGNQRDHDDELAARLARMNVAPRSQPSVPRSPPSIPRPPPSIDSISVSFGNGGTHAGYSPAPSSHVHVDVGTTGREPPPYCARHGSPIPAVGTNSGRGHIASPTPTPFTRTVYPDASSSTSHGYDMSSGPSRHSPEGGSLHAPLRAITPLLNRSGASNGHPFFVVLNARRNGIFNAPWNVVSMLVVSQPRAIWRSFRTLEEASAWYWDQLADD
ncbi:hypothetical protein BV25DRAFT_1922486 [Artomyces pyxidatus]|uniref:Uncharacterized protein n=1 Tax=Artomyces pyxidatus TaxID=48021 RepID=A0ACB8SG41_9AGAM|nr:hypothetical protein BV25DRAFT_1922486 [Artomyces pyxidatus]